MGRIADAYYTAGAAYAGLAGRVELGRSIFDADWDVCIVLDSARTDMMGDALPAICDRHHVGRAWSLGSVTTEWLASTFRESRRASIGKTALVTAHPHTATVFDEREWLTTPGKSPVSYPSVPTVDADAFAAIYRLYEHASLDHGAVPPGAMAEATVAAHRRHERVVAHWLQPHEPWIAPAATVVGGRATAANVWQSLASGAVDRRQAWQSYVATLHYALEHVQRVADSIDADILVTADHGNLFGELGLWGHPFGVWHPAVRRVPWCRLDGEARAPLDADPGILHGDREANVADQLTALGYA